MQLKCEIQSDPSDVRGHLDLLASAPLSGLTKSHNAELFAIKVHFMPKFCSSSPPLPFPTVPIFVSPSRSLFHFSVDSFSPLHHTQRDSLHS